MFNGTLDILRNHLGDSPIDAFICCASFEERSKRIAEMINPKYIGSSWIAFSRDFRRLSEQNMDAIKSIFPDKSRIMEFDTADPLLTADCIVLNLSDLCSGDPKRIVSDITSFTREALLILVKFLTERMRDEDSLEFLYTNAREYSIGDSGQDKWLSKGIKEVRSVLGYPGDLAPSKQDHLIVLVGFEDERALDLIREYEPSRISLGVANMKEEAAIPHLGTNIDRLRKLKNTLNLTEEFTFYAYDARATKIAIQQLIFNIPQNYNTIIAPMNTKISTIGAAAAALEDASIQICYGRANIYNTEKYSSPGTHFFHFSFRDICK